MPRPTPATRSFQDGALAIAPILLGVTPFAVIAGVAAVEIGLRPIEAVGFSVVVYAGASQLAAFELLSQDANVLVVIGTMLVINLRFVMYAASLSPHLAPEPIGRRIAAAYPLTDQAYAVSITRFASDEAGRVARLPYYLGAAIPMWVVWQLGTVAGAVLGDLIPAGVPLGFAVPLVFIALLPPAVTDRATLLSGVTAGVVAVTAAALPANLGLLLAAAAGIVVGSVAAPEPRTTRWTS